MKDMTEARVLSSEDVATLMSYGYTMMDIKELSDAEITTILQSTENYDEAKVRETETDISIWGYSQAR